MDKTYLKFTTSGIEINEPSYTLCTMEINEKYNRSFKTQNHNLID